jgi:hypothetical protein
VLLKSREMMKLKGIKSIIWEKRMKVKNRKTSLKLLVSKGTNLRWTDSISKWEPSNMIKTTFKTMMITSKTKKKKRKNNMKESWKMMWINKIKCSYKKMIKIKMKTRWMKGNMMKSLKIMVKS